MITLHEWYDCFVDAHRVFCIQILDIRGNDAVAQDLQRLVNQNQGSILNAYAHTVSACITTGIPYRNLMNAIEHELFFQHEDVEACIALVRIRAVLQRYA